MAFLLPPLENIRLMKSILILFLVLIFTNGFTQVTTWKAPAGYASEKFYQGKKISGFVDVASWTDHSIKRL